MCSARSQPIILVVEPAHDSAVLRTSDDDSGEIAFAVVTNGAGRIVHVHQDVMSGKQVE